MENNWSGRRDSNSQPPAWKASALPIELLPQPSRLYKDKCELASGNLIVTTALIPSQELILVH